MSRSPTENSDDTPAQDLDAYTNAASELNRLILTGRSFSGRERHCAYLNTGDGAATRFANISAVSGFDYDDDGRGMAPIDWDFDGDLDLWISNRTGPRVRFLRNDLDNDSHFAAFHLTGNGTTCNRDAIGARLELTLGDKELLRTLRAGEGYLTQLSKWVHFGLGGASRIDKLHIRWPDGSEQTLQSLASDRFYRIVQGQTQPTTWTPPQTTRTFEPSVVKARPSTQKAYLRLGSHPPLPRLGYMGFDGKPHRVRELLDKPLLLNLWATWCDPCKAELAELSRADVQVLALSVDGLGENADTTPEDAHRYLQEKGYRFHAGAAADRLVQLLQVFHDALYTNRRPLPIPTSFLIDVNGGLAAIYKGPVTLERLEDDLAHLDDPPDKLRDRAVPFKGRWFMPPITATPTNIAGAMISENMLDEASFYLIELGNQDADHPDRPSVMDHLARSLRKAGREDEAKSVEAAIQRLPPTRKNPYANYEE